MELTRGVQDHEGANGDLAASRAAPVAEVPAGPVVGDEGAMAADFRPGPDVGRGGRVRVNGLTQPGGIQPGSPVLVQHQADPAAAGQLVPMGQQDLHVVRHGLTIEPIDGELREQFARVHDHALRCLVTGVRRP